MIIKLVSTSAPIGPTVDNPGKPLWQSSSIDDHAGVLEQLSGSRLTEIWPGFQIAAWTKLRNLTRPNSESRESDEVEVWTETSLTSPSGTSSHISSLEVKEAMAVEEVVTSVLALAQVLSSNDEVWIRVE